MDLYFGVVLVTLALLAVTLVSVYSNRTISTAMKHGCVAICAFIGIALLGEWAGVVLDGADPSLRWLHIAVKTAEFCVAPAIGVATAHCYSGVVQRTRIMVVFTTAHAGLQIISAFFGWIFYVDGNNIYHRGTLYWAYVLAFSFSILYCFACVIREDADCQRRPDATLVATLAFLATGIVIQMSASDMRVDFLCVAIGNQLLYDHRCKIIAQLDGLTNLLNRRCYEKDLERVQPPAVILSMDVDRFKYLNDTYGHATGDYYLKAVAKAIHDVYGKKGACYRCGGDEFCVILDKDLDGVEELNGRFRQTLREMRKADQRMPDVSMGYARYDTDRSQIRDIIREADSMMYGRKQDEQDRIRQEESLDPLTGVYDTAGFHRQVETWIRNNPGRKYRIHRYNIDHFKDINGIYGYDMGNRLLRDCGLHMQLHDTKDSFSAHLNADHFARFCSADSPPPQTYYDGFAEAFADYKLKIPISMHMGVYDLCEPDCDSFTMSYKALLALQIAKGKSDRQIVYYEKGMMDAELEQQELLNDMERAIRQEEFEVWFQPQVNYRTRQLLGAEALVRWRHPKRGLLQPGMFIPALESSEQIVDVDHYVLEKTCRYVHRWREEMPERNVQASVNLSRVVVHRDHAAQRIREIVDDWQVPASCIRLEITESAYIEKPEKLVSLLNELREQGFLIEMDDFGSGYSSLNTLKDMDVDMLKLDMKFLSGGRTSQRSRDIISAVINMAEVLELPVIAEGVETKEQADMLLDFGCELMQGYYFSRPVPAEEYEQMLRGEKLWMPA